MSNVSSSPPPLNASERFRRGFKRVGIVVGILSGLAWVGYGVWDFNKRMTYLDRSERQMNCLAPIVSRLKAERPKDYLTQIISTASVGCAGPLERVTAETAEKGPATVEELRGRSVEFLTARLLEAAILIAAVYGLFAGVGWAASGFMRD